MWLQVGVASIPDTPTMLYAEITRGGRDPQFLQLLQNVRVGESHKVAVLEIAGKPNWWRVWLDGKPATDPILLEGSTNRWRPIATGESWNGGKSVCNRFAFRFDGVAVAGSAGGAWHTFAPGYLFQDRGFGVKQLSPSGRACAVRRQPDAVRLRGVLASRHCNPDVRLKPDIPAHPQLATTLIGVPSGMRSRRKAAVVFETRMQPCETARPSTEGSFQPCRPTTPPPGHSDSFE